MEFDSIVSFDSLYESMLKCERGVKWKPATKNFTLKGVHNCFKMEKQLKNGTFKNGKPNKIKITYPKKRDGLSISFRDRIYQRSLNDNYLYPIITKSFIYDNCACQKGKGTDFARRRIKKHLWNYYSNHGNDGWVLQIDIKGYYKNISVDTACNIFKNRVKEPILSKVIEIIGIQSGGNKGFFPGSQIVQLIGVALLDPLDHFIKETLRIKHYIRYMDDLWILGDDKEWLLHSLEEIKQKLSEYGLITHETKTKIRKLKTGFTFLGFSYRITDTGKVLMFVLGNNVKHEKRKLRNMFRKFNQNKMTLDKIEECYVSWRSHIAKGNTYKLLKRMDRFYFMEVQNA